MTQNLHTYYEHAPHGGIRAHFIKLRGDEFLALIAALDDRDHIVRRQKAERAAMVDGTLIERLDMLARHRVQLRDISARIESIKQLGA